MTEDERTVLRSLLGEMAWPAREGFPDIAYDSSDLQQRVSEATVSTLLRANSVLKTLTERAARPALFFPRGDGSGKFVVGLMTDANFDRQPRGGIQQGCIICCLRPTPGIWPCGSRNLCPVAIDAHQARGALDSCRRSSCCGDWL